MQSIERRLLASEHKRDTAQTPTRCLVIRQGKMPLPSWPLSSLRMAVSRPGPDKPLASPVEGAFLWARETPHARRTRFPFGTALVAPRARGWTVLGFDGASMGLRCPTRARMDRSLLILASASFGANSRGRRQRPRGTIVCPCFCASHQAQEADLGGASS